jgi:hypothetical protein
MSTMGGLRSAEMFKGQPALEKYWSLTKTGPSLLPSPSPSKTNDLSPM